MTVTARQRVPVPLPDVERFFSDTASLLLLVPPYPRLSIEAASTRVAEGAEYLLRFDFLLFPLHWRARIESVIPGRGFVDTARVPLAGDWRHTHLYRAVAGGSIVEDEIRCTPPPWAAPVVRAGLSLMLLHRKRALVRALR